MGSYGELGEKHFAGISKIGIKQHLLIENVHGTSFVAMVTHQCITMQIFDTYKESEHYLEHSSHGEPAFADSAPLCSTC